MSHRTLIALLGGAATRYQQGKAVQAVPSHDDKIFDLSAFENCGLSLAEAIERCYAAN